MTFTTMMLGNKRVWLPVLTVFLLLLSVLGESPTYAAPSQQSGSVRDLWIDVSIGAPLVDWFNRVARPDDVARVENVAQIGLLDEITVGRKLVVFKSVSEAEAIVPDIADQIDIIGYNLEHGPANPMDEQADPIESVRRMRELTDRHDLLLAVGPDRDFAVSDGAAMAPYADIFVLQVQRAQTEPFRVRNFVEPVARELVQANPDLAISVQVRTEGDVVALVDLIASLEEHLDGVSILTSPTTVDVAEDLVTELRTRTVVQPTATIETRPEETPTPVATATTEPNPEQTPVRLTPVATSTPAPATTNENSGVSWLAVIMTAIVAGAVAGGITAALVSGIVRR